MAGITDVAGAAGGITPWGAIIDTAAGVGLSAYQLARAKQLQKQLGSRPQYNFNYAKAANQGQLNLAQGEMPGLTQQMAGVNQTLANTTQSIANMAPSGAAALGALVQAGAGTQQAQNDILGNAIQQRLGLQQNYLEGLSGLQQYGDKAFQLNQYEPYMMKVNEIAALKQAGMQNLGGAASSLGSTLDEDALAKYLAQFSDKKIA